MIRFINFYIALRRERIVAQMPIEELANRTGLSARRLLYIEQGFHVPSLEKLDRILEAFDISMYDFWRRAQWSERSEENYREVYYEALVKALITFDTEDREYAARALYLNAPKSISALVETLSSNSILGIFFIENVLIKIGHEVGDQVVAKLLATPLEKEFAIVFLLRVLAGIAWEDFISVAQAYTQVPSSHDIISSNALRLIAEYPNPTQVCDTCYGGGIKDMEDCPTCGGYGTIEREA